MNARGSEERERLDALKSAVCPVHRECGGCPSLADPTRAARARARLAALVDETLSIDWVSVNTLQYRRRLRMRIDHDGKASLFNPHKSLDCAVLTPSLRETINEVASLRFENTAHIEVRARDLDGNAGLCMYGLTQEREPGFRGDLRNFMTVPDDWQRWRITGEIWAHVPLTSFLQVHESTNARLIDALVRGALARSVTSFIEPFAGAGNQTLPLLAAGMRGVASDIDARGTRALAASARAQGLTVRTEVGPADATVADLASADIALPDTDAPDLVVANPPRAGLRSALPPLVRLRARHLALVTCTFRAFERDYVRLRPDYRLSELTLFDMFPQTDHVEILAWFERRAL